MLDIGEYIIDEPYRQYGNGYDQLDGEWLTYYKVATKFCHKARYEDREDLLHTIILSLAVAGRSNGDKPDNPSWMYRIASFSVAQYWRDYHRRVNGTDCGHCSNPQRKKCKADNLYSKCPKAIRIESLSKPIVDGDGHITELIEFIADDHAIDIVARLDARCILQGLPRRLVQIAYKKRAGYQLNGKERKYLCKWLKTAQKPLF